MTPYYQDKWVTIYHGDCRDVLRYLPQKSDLILIDPPYVTTNEKRDIEVVDHKLSGLLYNNAKDTTSLYVWCGIGERSQSLIRWFPIFSRLWYFKDLITWKKQRGIGMRRGWLYSREEIMWFVKNKSKFTWNKEEQYSTEKPTYRPTYAIKNNLYKSDFKRITNVWIDIFEDGMGTSCQNSTKVSQQKKEGNIAIKPLKAIERIIKVHTQGGDIILDSFLGTGATAIACIKTNRRCIGIEIEEKYCEIAAKRCCQEVMGLGL